MAQIPFSQKTLDLVDRNRLEEYDGEGDSLDTVCVHTTEHHTRFC